MKLLSVKALWSIFITLLPCSNKLRRIFANYYLNNLLLLEFACLEILWVVLNIILNSFFKTFNIYVVDILALSSFSSIILFIYFAPDTGILFSNNSLTTFVTFSSLILSVYSFCLISSKKFYLDLTFFIMFLIVIKLTLNIFEVSL